MADGTKIYGEVDLDATLSKDPISTNSSGKIISGTTVTIENAETNSSIIPVVDGTYTVGKAITPISGIDGTITVKSGIITAIQQAT